MRLLSNLVIVLLLSAIVYVLGLLGGQYGFKEYIAIRASVKLRQQQNEVLFLHNRNLKQLSQKRLLPSYFEHQAREHLKLIKKGEHYHTFTQNNP